MIYLGRTALNINPKKCLSGVALLIFAYIFGSVAIDSGSYLAYLGCFVTLVFGIKLIVSSLKKDGKKV